MGEKHHDSLMIEVGRRILFMGELAAREVEAENPDVAPISRSWLAKRIVDEIQKRNADAQKRTPK